MQFVCFRKGGITATPCGKTPEQHFLCENTLKLVRLVGGGGSSSTSMASDSTKANVNGGEAGSLNGEPVLKRPRESGSQVSSLRVPKEPHNKVTVVLGAQWGDEGKGKVVDLLAMDADIVCRCQVVHGAARIYDYVFKSRLLIIRPLRVRVFVQLPAK